MTFIRRRCSKCKEELSFSENDPCDLCALEEEFPEVGSEKIVGMPLLNQPPDDLEFNSISIDGEVIMLHQINGSFLRYGKVCFHRNGRVTDASDEPSICSNAIEREIEKVQQRITDRQGKMDSYSDGWLHGRLAALLDVKRLMGESIEENKVNKSAH
jgi:hypothetical protein